MGNGEAVSTAARAAARNGKPFSLMYRNCKSLRSPCKLSLRLSRHIMAVSVPGEQRQGVAVEH